MIRFFLWNNIHGAARTIESRDLSAARFNLDQKDTNPIFGMESPAGSRTLDLQPGRQAPIGRHVDILSMGSIVKVEHLPVVDTCMDS